MLTKHTHIDNNMQIPFLLVHVCTIPYIYNIIYILTPICSLQTLDDPKVQTLDGTRLCD